MSESNSIPLANRVALLHAVNIFAEADDAVLERLAPRLTEERFGFGEVIFNKGELGDALFIVVEGHIKVHHGDHVYAEMGPQMVFGEYALVEKMPRSATVTALEFTTLLRLGHKDFHELFAESRDFTRGLMRSLISRLVSSNQLEEDLAASKKRVERQRAAILDSITYASRIQGALMKPEERLSQLAGGAFVFFRPRDLVSGDFYWFAEVDGHLVVAAVDCTGHGVPGAMMSMIGNTLLNQIILADRITDPGTILDRLHKDVLTSLQQKEGEPFTEDGMDMALCTVSPDGKELALAGARNQAIIVRAGELEVIPGQPFSIGGRMWRSRKANKVKFESHRIALDGPCSVYLFSDGFMDQFGGPNNKKYNSLPFRELLSDLSQMPFSEQGEAIASEFGEWKGSEQQVDDVLVVGFGVSP